jgi:spore maturation protein SpmA
VLHDLHVFKALFNIFLLEGDGPAIDLTIQLLLGICNSWDGFPNVSEPSGVIKRLENLRTK